MGSVVVGIFPDHDSCARLAHALKSDGLDAERLRVISNDTPSDNLIRTGVQFVYSGDAEDEAVGVGGGIITGFGGMGVPGLTDNTPQVQPFHTPPSTEELLGELEIPSKRHDAYCSALDHGRSVAGYLAGTHVDKVKALFAAAGADPVEVF